MPHNTLEKRRAYANALKGDGTLDEHRRIVAWMERELEPDRVLHTEGIIL